MHVNVDGVRDLSIRQYVIVVEPFAWTEGLPCGAEDPQVGLQVVHRAVV